MDNVHLLTYIQQQGRRIKIAFALQRLTAQRHPRPLRHRLRHFARHLVPRRRVDQRPHRDVISRRRVAKLDGLHRLTESVDEAVVYSLLNIDPLDAVTHLPGVNHPRVHYRFHRQLQIRIVHYNGRRFAAELEAHFGDIFRRSGHNFSPAATLPVMLTIATFGLPASSWPTVSPRPSTRLKTPFGNPT